MRSLRGKPRFKGRQIVGPWPFAALVRLRRTKRHLPLCAFGTQMSPTLVRQWHKRPFRPGPVAQPVYNTAPYSFYYIDMGF